MYDFGLSCDVKSPGSDASALWRGAAVPAIDFFLLEIGSGNIRFFRPGSSGRWRESLGPMHRYQSEVFFQVQGSCRFVFPSEELEIVPGDVLLVPLGMPHLEYARDCGGKAFFNLVLTVSEGRATLHVGGLRAGAVRADKPGILLRRELGNPPFYQGVVTALSQSPLHDPTGAGAALLEALLRRLAGDLRIEAAPEAGVGSPYSFAHRAKSLLDEGGRAMVLDVARLAKELGCSPGYLSHSFRLLYGVPLNHYIRSLRLEYARRLLNSGECNIAEIAERCGFRDASYFSRRFRERFGISPGKLR